VSLLLDTHVVPWWLAGTGLDDAVVERISDGGELVAVSAASIWEAAIKAAVGKLRIPGALAAAVVDEGFEPLPVTLEHAEMAGALPPHHRDPFDRMLVAQAQSEHLTLVTHDPAFGPYGVAIPPVRTPPPRRRRRRSPPVPSAGTGVRGGAVPGRAGRPTTAG
jgi:PIN domain nuclease of toxin-antitoxin system